MITGLVGASLDDVAFSSIAQNPLLASLEATLEGASLTSLVVSKGIKFEYLYVYGKGTSMGPIGTANRPTTIEGDESRMTAFGWTRRNK